MDKRGLGFNPDELEPVDSCREPAWVGRTSTTNSVRPSKSVNLQPAEGTCFSLREASGNVWFKTCALGWSHRGRASEETVWAKANGEAGSALDASVGVPVKTSQLCLSSSARREDPTISEGFKKDSRPWVLRKRLFSG